jgi:hypothetical protein
MEIPDGSVTGYSVWRLRVVQYMVETSSISHSHLSTVYPTATELYGIHRWHGISEKGTTACFVRHTLERNLDLTFGAMCIAVRKHKCKRRNEQRCNLEGSCLLCEGRLENIVFGKTNC